MTRKQKRFWTGAGLVSTEMLATLVVFTGVLSGVIFLIRPRMSFPSGHAMMSVTFYGLIIYIVSHEVKSQFLRTLIIMHLILLMQVIGFSRVYLRVHYASDVVVGHITGLLWLLISLGVLKRLEEYNKEKALKQGNHLSIIQPGTRKDALQLG